MKEKLAFVDNNFNFKIQANEKVLGFIAAKL